MTVNGQQDFKDVSIPFAYVRPRVLLLVSAAIAIFGVWLALNPTEIDRGYATGGIDLFLRSLPLNTRIVVCCAMVVWFVWAAYVTCWPCVRDKSIIVFDGERIHGYDFWGQKTSVLKSEIQAVSYRCGGASARTADDKIWIPLSLLNIDEEYRTALKGLLGK